MKTYINREIVVGPYGGGNNFVTAFHELAPKFDDVEVMRSKTGNINPEVILLAGLSNEGAACISAEQAIMYKLYVKPDCKIVLRVNENDVRKGTTGVDDMLLKVSKHIDGTVFVSKWLQEYFVRKGWGCQNQTVIINGVQRNVFNQQSKLNNGKINIVAHHWSDNTHKGSDFYEQIDEFVGKNSEDFTFTYIGRHKCDFKHTKVVKPLHGKALGEELGKHDVYVSASRWDPGPNHIIESISCGLPTYVYKDGGGCVEFAGNDHVFNDWNELKTLLLSKTFTQNSTKFSTWNDCISQCVNYLKSLHQTST